MTTYAGRPVFPTFFVDQHGNPSVGSITIYNRGTTVKATLYTDRTKGTTTPNPTTTDTAGNAFPYLDPGDYDALVGTTPIPFTVLPDPAEPNAIIGGTP
jgi:hypothetical protein